ncbi:hypothetical protein [Bacteroidetes bacterium endosymbiont of Geopemphigus sp.]|nr:hypothetical protein [Bacteroidetes bacterium endosymbiont of Geopemphigus sp.]
MAKGGAYLGDREIKAASKFLDCRIDVESDKTNHSFNGKAKDSIDLVR